MPLAGGCEQAQRAHAGLCAPTCRCGALGFGMEDAIARARAHNAIASLSSIFSSANVTICESTNLPTHGVGSRAAIGGLFTSGTMKRVEEEAAAKQAKEAEAVAAREAALSAPHEGAAERGEPSPSPSPKQRRKRKEPAPRDAERAPKKTARPRVAFGPHVPRHSPLASAAPSAAPSAALDALEAIEALVPLGAVAGGERSERSERSARARERFRFRFEGSTPREKMRALQSALNDPVAWQTYSLKRASRAR